MSVKLQFNYPLFSDKIQCYVLWNNVWYLYLQYHYKFSSINMSDIDVSTFISYSQHNINNITIYTYENHVEISICVYWLCLNVINISISPTFIVIFSEKINDIYIYSVYSQFSSINMANNYVRIYLNCIQHTMLAIINKLIICILRVKKVHVSIIINENHVGIFFCWDDYRPVISNFKTHS